MSKNVFVSGCRRGDVIEVRLQDTSFNTFFKRKVRVDDVKGMRQLVSDLRDKGVKLPIESWL